MQQTCQSWLQDPLSTDGCVRNLTQMQNPMHMNNDCTPNICDQHQEHSEKSWLGLSQQDCLLLTADASVVSCIQLDVSKPHQGCNGRAWQSMGSCLSAKPESMSVNLSSANTLSAGTSFNVANCLNDDHFWNGYFGQRGRKCILIRMKVVELFLGGLQAGCSIAVLLLQ